MPKIQSGSKQWESPQVEPKQTGTKIKGGMAPSKEDIMDSANARGTKRHDMKGQALADVGVLPDSAAMMGNEMVGIKNHGYLVKKNLEFGPQVHYNSLPPGMDIEDQENCDIRKMEMKTVTAMGYPGDGWTDGEDYGRPGMTNYGGGAKS